MTYFDPDKAYLEHTPQYKLPHGRMWPVEGVPGASGIGPLWEAEQAKLGVIDFQMRGAARSFGNGVNFVSGIVSEGEYGQFVFQDNVTVENIGFQGVINDVAVGNQEDAISWTDLPAGQDNYLFVKLIDDDSDGGVKNSRRDGAVGTFAQNTFQSPNINSMVVAYRPSGVNSEIVTDISGKSYINLQHHIDAKNPHGNPWMQSGVIVCSGIISQTEAIVRGNLDAKSGIEFRQQAVLSSAAGFVWPDAVFQNDLLVRDGIDFKDNVEAQQISGVDIVVGSLHVTHSSVGSPYSSGTLVGPGVAPLASGAQVGFHNFGNLQQSGNIIFAGQQFVIDSVRPSINGDQLDDHLVASNPHHLTPVRLSGVGRFGVGDPNQWAVDPGRPPADSKYWRMQGDWPVLSGVTLDGVDFSTMNEFINGSVADPQSSNSSVGISGISVYRFEEIIGSAYAADSMSVHTLDQILNADFHKPSVNGDFGYAIQKVSGAGHIKGDRPLPSDAITPFTAFGWFKGDIGIDLSGVTLIQHADRNARGWAVTKDSSKGSGVQLEMYSAQNGSKSIIRNERSALNNNQWNFVSVVYDGTNAFLAVNGLVQSGAAASNGWANPVAVADPARFAVLSSVGVDDAIEEIEGSSYAKTRYFTAAEFASGNGQIAFVNDFGQAPVLFTLYEQIGDGIYKARNDVQVVLGSSTIIIQQPDPSQYFAGKIVYSVSFGSDSGFSQQISSGTAGWSGYGNGTFVHGTMHSGSSVALLQNFFINPSNNVYSGAEALFIADNASASWSRSGVDVAVGSAIMLSEGVRGILNVEEKDFRSLQFVSSGIGAYQFEFEHPFKSSNLIVNVYRRLNHPIAGFLSRASQLIGTSRAEVQVDSDVVRVIVLSSGQRFNGKIVVGDGTQHVGGGWDGAYADDIVYEVGKSWPQYQQDYSVQQTPFTSGVNGGNPTNYYHQHLLLPPAGEFISIAPEFPGLCVSGLSPGTFETSRRFDQNWYDWYSYQENDVIVYSRIGIPTGVTKLADIKMRARASSGGKGLSKIQVSVRDTDDAIVQSVPSHWLMPSDSIGDVIVFSGGGIGSDLGGRFESGKKFELQVRMRSVSGYGIHLGPVSMRFE